MCFANQDGLFVKMIFVLCFSASNGFLAVFVVFIAMGSASYRNFAWELVKRGWNYFQIVSRSLHLSLATECYHISGKFLKNLLDRF